ncbi:MAG: hypothetical protein QF902_08430 [Rhodospirillales bacterium]|nr:hypothetical protein [Rhodospirillales bacterium]
MKRIISKARSLIAGAPRKRTARTTRRDGDATASPRANKPALESVPEPEAPENDTLEALENAVVESRAPGPDRESRPQPEPDRRAAAAEPETETPPERQTLIRSALATRRRQSKVLANLSAGERKKLRLLASKLLMGNDPGQPH